MSRGGRAPARVLKRVLLAAGVLVALAIAAEIALRAIVPGVLSTAIRDAFDLSEDHPVEVTTGGIMLLPALAGRVDDVTVSVPDAPVLDGLHVTLGGHADSLPLLDRSGPVEGATVQAVIPRDQLGTAVSLVTGGVADSGTVEGDTIRVGRDIDIFGQRVPLRVDLRLGVHDGEVLVTPESVQASMFELSAEELGSLTGGMLDGILTEHRVCVRDRLPKAVTLTEVTVSTTGGLVVEAMLSRQVLSDEGQLAPGSC